jgi:nucleoside-diphosphate-sugar epimerase
MKRILVTGTGGFIGSHVAEQLLIQNFQVLGTKRKNSDLWRCKEFYKDINWIDTDNLIELEEKILDFKPEILIHTAWSGVNASDRDDWNLQFNNLDFFIKMLLYSKKAGISKIIALGSQAEYGNFEGIVSEKSNILPNSSYGTIKTCALQILKDFSNEYKIEWYWLRLFSIYGPKEDKNWLIPLVINNILSEQDIELTPCEQKYDYLYVKDLVKGILCVINNGDNLSGVFNLTSNSSIKLKNLLQKIEYKIRKNKSFLKIGKLGYRKDQVMHMEGNSDLFYKTFMFKPSYSIEEGLIETIDYYSNENQSEKHQ